MALPTYPWFDQVPEHLKTRRQLAELGLRPGGPVVAQVVWHRGDRWADLYDVNEGRKTRMKTDPISAAVGYRMALERILRAQGPHEMRQTAPLSDGLDSYNRYQRERRSLELERQQRENDLWYERHPRDA